MAVSLLTVALGGCTGSSGPAGPRPAPSPTVSGVPVPVTPGIVPVPSSTIPDPAAALPGADGSGQLPSLVRVALPQATRGVVLDAASGRVLLDVGSSTPLLAASTTKLLTAAAALEVLGAETRLRTRVLATGPIHSGTLAGDLVLRGAGDPTLTAQARPLLDSGATVAALVNGVKAAGVRHVQGRVLADTSLFTGPPLGLGWVLGYLTGGSVAQVTPLSLEGGRKVTTEWVTPRVLDPALAAAAEFTRQLRLAGVAVDGPPVLGVRRGTEITGVLSAPIRLLVKKMLQESDNDIAESLGRLVSLDLGGQADFEGAARAVLHSVPLDVSHTELHDASGLSREDRIAPRLLAELVRLTVTGGHPELRAISEALPVSGRVGTLAKRFLTGPASRAIGRVHAKTGRLNGLVSLAGWTRTRSGRMLTFSFVTESAIGSALADAALDRTAATLAVLG
jgi:D-alanyl-D-alanine carboxypeptidase/D-alanyl-D-alanine-endopeptidase (penicillin-binding protein 4)